MNPTRRDAVKGVVALAAGLFAAPAAKAAPAHDDAEHLRRIAQHDREEDEYRREEEEYRGKPGSDRRRRCDEAMLRMLLCWQQVEDAMEAVLDDDECGPDCAACCAESDQECFFHEEVDGIRYLAGRFPQVFESELPVDLEDAAQRERQRWQEAFRRGSHCACPVWWGKQAIDAAQAELQAVVKLLAGHADSWTAREAGCQLWAAALIEGVYHAEFNVHLNEAARAAWSAEVRSR